MEDRIYSQSPSRWYYDSRSHDLITWSFFRFPINTAYVEGWGLYSERLGFDINAYEDPLDRFGHLSEEIFRACRLGKPLLSWYHIITLSAQLWTRGCTLLAGHRRRLFSSCWITPPPARRASGEWLRGSSWPGSSPWALSGRRSLATSPGLARPRHTRSARSRSLSWGRGRRRSWGTTSTSGSSTRLSSSQLGPSRFLRIRSTNTLVSIIPNFKILLKIEIWHHSPVSTGTFALWPLKLKNQILNAKIHEIVDANSDYDATQLVLPGSTVFLVSVPHRQSGFPRLAPGCYCVLSALSLSCIGWHINTGHAPGPQTTSKIVLVYKKKKYLLTASFTMFHC